VSFTIKTNRKINVVGRDSRSDDCEQCHILGYDVLESDRATVFVTLYTNFLFSNHPSARSKMEPPFLKIKYMIMGCLIRAIAHFAGWRQMTEEQW
jgi:hypothetical protein